MATFKKRLNITLAPTVETQLFKLARRDQVPAATKAAALIQQAIEIEEDDYFNQLAQQRDTPQAKFVSHANAW